MQIRGEASASVRAGGGAPAPLKKVALAYAVMAVVAAALFFVIRAAGEGLPVPAGAAASPALPAGPSINTLFYVLLALAVIVVVARASGYVFSRLGQPAVIGEVVGGILLGPSLLGRLAPDLQAALLPPEVAPFLGVHAQLGVILYMFLVGLALDLSVIRRSGHATVAISHASIVVPFVLGSWLALALYPTLSSGGSPFTVFALFLGVSMSVTAFPVLARILTDRGISRTRMGVLALTCAAVDDVTAWCLLAVVVSIAQTRAADAVWTIVLTVAFIIFVLGVVGPLVRRVVPRFEGEADLTRAGWSIVVVAMLASAATTE